MTPHTLRLRRPLAVAATALCGLLLLGACGSETHSGALQPPDDTAIETTVVTEPATTTTTEPPTTTTTAPPPTTAPATESGTVPDPTPAAAPGLPVTGRLHVPDPVIFVTIDDGAVRDPAVVDFLAYTGMPVSMFLNAQYVNADPGYFGRIHALGNQLHTHTLNHLDLKKLSPADQHNEICGMRDLLQNTYGPVGTLFRPPYGSYDESTKEQAASCGLTALVTWAGELQNGSLKLQASSLRQGDIILTHFRKDTLANLKEIKRLADARGLRIARLEDYLQ